MSQTPPAAHTVTSKTQLFQFNSLGEVHKFCHLNKNHHKKKGKNNNITEGSQSKKLLYSRYTDDKSWLLTMSGKLSF